MRAGRPLLLQGILRFDSLRAIARIATLAALDLAGLVLAIYTALVLKTAIVNPDQLGQMWGQTKDYAPLAGLVMLLLFARSGLYRDRAQRPGFSKVIASLFQVTLVVLVYASIEGENFQSYYIFYSSLFFALLYVSALRFLFERGSGVERDSRTSPSALESVSSPRRLPPGTRLPESEPVAVTNPSGRTVRANRRRERN